MENVQYSSWAELFKITARAYQVLDHIVPPSATEKAKEALSKTETDKNLWDRLDAIVLQWIYGTISTDLLHTILEPSSTAQQACDRLRDVFQDNRNSRALYLGNQFSSTFLQDFPNCSAYCEKLKVLADQLANIGSPVSNDRLVLRLVAGLNENYSGIATIIQQSDPLPNF
ncbi:uncharacterized protein LOC141665058 [Apium graveolens]|uniref:uncharacterized protein LOC141665058 n=1 Tax=Apium graveolens TaxID=4045 RepID=UPI003D791D0F